MRALPAPSVVIAADDNVLLDEMVRFLEEIPHWTVRSVVDLGGFDAALTECEPEAVVVSDSVAKVLAGLGRQIAARVVVFGREDSKETLRAAIKLGSVGFIRWPEERSQLKPLVEGGMRHARTRASGELVAMWSPKGGGGASVLAAHLAASVSHLGGKPLLVDLDLDSGDQALILGAEDKSRSLTDLLRIVDELTPNAADAACSLIDGGSKVLLSVGVPGESQLVKPGDVVKLLSILRESSSLVIADLASSSSEINVAVIEEATKVLMVITPTALSLRRGREAVRSLASLGVEVGKVRLVLNQYMGGQIASEEVQAIVGAPVAAVIRADMELLRAPDRGSLSQKGERLLEPLARQLMGLPERSAARFGFRR